jgi:hypothetical protein
LVEIAHKEEAEAADKSVISDIGGIMVVFVGAIEDHGDDGKYQHDGFAVFVLIEYICQDVHDEKSYQEPSYTVELAGETAV